MVTTFNVKDSRELGRPCTYPKMLTMPLPYADYREADKIAWVNRHSNTLVVDICRFKHFVRDKRIKQMSRWSCSNEIYLHGSLSYFATFSKVKHLASPNSCLHVGYQFRTRVVQIICSLLVIVKVTILICLLSLFKTISDIWQIDNTFVILRGGLFKKL